MKRNATVAVVALLILGGTSHTFTQGPIHRLRPASARSFSNATRREVVERYAKLPLRFEPNRGQTDSQVQFLSRGNGYALFLTRTESVLTLRSTDAVVRMQLLGANTAARATGVDEQAGKSNYFVGNDPAKWRTNVPNYAKVRFESVFPRVDLVYYGNQRLLEYDFIVAPGGDPRLIRLGVDTNEQMHIDSAGDLIVETHAGAVRWHKPVVYQDIAGVRRSVTGRYVQTAPRSLGFDVGSYDRHYPLVIDPVLVYSTYLGGNNSGETGVGIAVDAAGAAYVTGSTGSTNFPAVNAFQPALGSNGSTNAFVTKLDPSGGGLIYSTYLGGSGDGSLPDGDQGTGIAVDADGNAYVTGYTFSSNFPTLHAFQSNLAGGPDQFVTKLNATGSALIYSSYLGGTGQEGLSARIKVDAAGNAYVAGETFSSDFPTVNAFQARLAGQSDAYVAKVNPSGTGLIYSTYLGGTGSEGASDLAVDASGNVYLTGGTSSIDFPVLSSLQAYKGGGSDVFVTKLNNSGTGLIFSTYLGGSDADGGGGIALDASNNVYVAGGTRSTDFPTTLGAYQTTNAGGNDVFVTEIQSAGNGLLYSTYFGGSHGEGAVAIKLDPVGNVYIAGSTGSDDLPVSDPVEPYFNGGISDTFVAELDPKGVGTGSLVYATYLGGTGNDTPRDLAVDSSGAAYVTGVTNSIPFPTTAGAFQQGFGGGVNDGFVAKLSGSVTAPDTTAPVLSGVPASFSVEATGPGGAVVIFATPTATDPDDAAGAVTCSPASGTIFPFGVTQVTCSSTDTHGNVGTAIFMVTVADTTAPALSLPAAITVLAASSAGTAVSYTASASDLVSGPVAVTCSPSSGSTFAVGTTVVTCSASDASGNTATGTFTITVLSPAQLFSRLATSAAAFGFQQAVNLLQNAASSFNRGDTAAACGQLGAFINQVLAQRGKSLTVDQANQLLQQAMAIKAALGCP